MSLVGDYALFYFSRLLRLELGLTDLTTDISLTRDFTAVIFLTNTCVTVYGHHWFTFLAFSFSFASVMIPANSTARRLLCLYYTFDDLLFPNTSIQLLNFHLKIYLSLCLFGFLTSHSFRLLLVWMLTYMLKEIFRCNLFGKMLHLFSTLGVWLVFYCLLEIALNCD
jgi:hypothetical protein